MTTAVATDRPGVSNVVASRSSEYGNSDAPTPALWRNATDDEILGLGVRVRSRAPFEGGHDEVGAEQEAIGVGARTAPSDDIAAQNSPVVGEAAFGEIFEAQPELKKAWTDAASYRESFATPDEARTAAKQLSEVAAMDALFFSTAAEDQTKLARLLAEINPNAFEAFAAALGQVSGERRRLTRASPHQAEKSSLASAGAEEQFLQQANATAVGHILEAIDAQVDRLLPANISKSARNRTVGEIYRELDAMLQSHSDFENQIRLAVRSGNLDPRHREAIVSMVVGRAKQTLPGAAKKVLGEWTSTVVAAEHDRRDRQRSAESRVDIAGARGASEKSRRITSPRDINYTRMSDADILNL